MTLKSKKSKNPPMFSQEYFIQNHGDIVSFLPAILMLGLMFSYTQPLCAKFVAPQHGNTTVTPTGNVTLYTAGRFDMLGVFFYASILVVVHAVVQEHILDRVIRKLHLSKAKNAKFNESGQLFWFYAISFGWTLYIIIQEEYFAKLSNFWELYPFTPISLQTKVFFISQIAYWVHALPELYLQKAKKEDLGSKIGFISVNLAFVIVPYLLNLGRIAVLLLSLHYFVESIYHIVRLAFFADKTHFAKWGFRVCNILYVFARLITIGFGILVFFFGLEKTTQPTVNFKEGNFNTKMIRLNCLVAVIASQIFMMYSFTSAHLRRLREHRMIVAQRKATAAKRQRDKKDHRDKKRSASGSGKESAEDSGADVSDSNEPTATEEQQAAAAAAAASEQTVTKRAAATKSKK